MSHRVLFPCAILVVLLFSHTTSSQEHTALPKPDETAAAASRKKAIGLLDAVAGQIDTLRSGENRARIGSNAADMLWTHDEKRARSLFAAVAEDIKIGFADADSDREAHAHTFMVFGKLRGDTIERIATHDPDLALEFLRSTKPALDEEALPPQFWENEKALELRLATQIAVKSPQLALKLGRESLANGLSPELLPLLVRLEPRDREVALILFREIVEKLKSTNVGQDLTATSLAIGLAREFQAHEIEETVYRDLIAVVFKGLLGHGCGDSPAGYEAQQICFESGQLFPRIERYYGPRAAPLKRWASDEPFFDDFRGRVRATLEKGTADEILALLPKYPELDQRIYWSAVMRAHASGDAARARRIASEVPDATQRQNLLDELDRYEKREPVTAARLTEIQKSIGRLQNDQQKTQMLMFHAVQVGQSDRKSALGLLAQAGEIIETMRPARSQLGAQVRLALIYCLFKSERGFAIMESLMPRLNELVAAAAVLDKVENNYLRDGEWNMTAEGVVGNLLTFLAQNAGYFAAFDFDRSVTLAGQLARPELRLMAQLKIAQGILSPPQPGMIFQ